jgi:hypothetical protein
MNQHYQTTRSPQDMLVIRVGWLRSAAASRLTARLGACVGAQRIHVPPVLLRNLWRNV